MAIVIPFRRGPVEPPLQSGTPSPCSNELQCPTCDFTACSSSELHLHIEQMHPPEPR
jgi:hypothetical protein